MGSLIEDLKKLKPEFRNEFDNYIQKVKIENREELSNLHSTISSLRDQLESTKFKTKDLVQRAVSNKTDEINQLKLTISELRVQLENLKFEKQKAILIFLLFISFNTDLIL